MDQEKCETAAELASERREELLGRIGQVFARREPRLQARKYVTGLMSDLPRKNGWTLAEAAGDRSPDKMQRLLNHASWQAHAAMLATGMAAQTGRRSVVGMLAGAGMAQKISFHAAGRFFSHCVRDIDRLGLAAAGLIVRSLLGPDEPIVVAVDDTLFKRWGRKVHGVFWTHDGSAAP